MQNSSEVHLFCPDEATGCTAQCHLVVKGQSPRYLHSCRLAHASESISPFPAPRPLLATQRSYNPPVPFQLLNDHTTHSIFRPVFNLYAFSSQMHRRMYLKVCLNCFLFSLSKNCKKVNQNCKYLFFILLHT